MNPQMSFTEIQCFGKIENFDKINKINGDFFQNSSDRSLDLILKYSMDFMVVQCIFKEIKIF